jgi:hypothetical protein
MAQASSEATCFYAAQQARALVATVLCKLLCCLRACSRQRARALLLTAVALTVLPASAAVGPSAPVDPVPARPSRIADDQFLPAPVELQVELLPVPVLGLSERAPRFSWVAEVPPGTRGLAQTAYRVRVARATEPKVTTCEF